MGGNQATKAQMSAKIIGIIMDDIIHSVWGVKIHDSTHPKELKSFQLYQFLLPTKSKHLTGRLGPRVGNVTFLDQSRSVGTIVGDVTFLDQWRSVGTRV